MQAAYPGTAAATVRGVAVSARGRRVSPGPGKGRRSDMKYDEFIDAVAIRAGVSPDDAEVLTYATLQTLAERLTGGEADDLASQLPQELQDTLQKEFEQAEDFGLEEFVRRVSLNAGTDTALAWQGVRAVMATLQDAVTAGEFDDVMAQLPNDFMAVLQPQR
jgi:uncharacterized protein (DUF2267 family)